MNNDKKNKRKKAAALSYDSETGRAPRIIAKGSGFVAEKIVAKAKEHKIIVKEDPELAEAFSRLDLYQEIPEELYRVAAELLAEVYKINSFS
ncbi:MAG: EscU/YscU/HrcU family type III secretion system export apparatus switch protein [Deferribacteraceae bacterium]|jgi:flagellar biosynthesis protein|nr:EscU/YscU/HrcU family type III secretion system export apparatus switch protein [Deferribacteraceae bacterium]